LQENNSEVGQDEAHTSLNEKNKTSNEATMNGNADGAQNDEEEEHDPHRLSLAEENITVAL